MFASSKVPAQGEGPSSSEKDGVCPRQNSERLVFSWFPTIALTFPSSQELGCSYTHVAAQDGEAVLRAILASQQPERCKRAQAFISTQGLEPDTVAELVAEEVTQELLSPPEGTGTLPSKLPQPFRPLSQVPTVMELDDVLIRILHGTLSGCQVALVKGEHFAFIVFAFLKIVL